METDKTRSAQSSTKITVELKGRLVHIELPAGCKSVEQRDAQLSQVFQLPQIFPQIRPAPHDS